MLFRTGDQSRDFAVVLATNRPADLDAAVIDRMDEAIEFPLPGLAERSQILRMYIDSYIAKAGTSEGKPLAWSSNVASPICALLFIGKFYDTLQWEFPSVKATTSTTKRICHAHHHIRQTCSVINL